ncbi:MAG: hypothetical protein R3Y32_03405 [Bacillota bacterium]
MANKTMNVTLLLRNDPASVWESSNPILAKGEIGVENDTRKFKFGDGVTAYNSLAYASSGAIEVNTTSPLTTDIGYDVGAIWLNTTTQQLYVLFASDTTATWIEIPNVSGTIDKANQLATARTFTFDGAVVSNSKSFDGSGNVTFTLVLAGSGVTAGTYTKLTVNDKGIVTSATTLTAADIPDLTLSKITDAGTAASKDVGTESGNVPILGSDGKLDTSVIPSVAMTDVHVVASETAMLALEAQQGDVAVRTDQSKTYILATNTPATLDSWVLLQTPADSVISVNGKTGAVTLTTSDVSEGTNLYFTTARFDTAFGTKSIADLSDGDTVMTTADDITLNGGNA